MSTFDLHATIAGRDVRIRGDYLPAERPDPSVGYPGCPAELETVADVTALDPWRPLDDAEVTAFAAAHLHDIEDALHDHLRDLAELERQRDECVREDMWGAP